MKQECVLILTPLQQDAQFISECLAGGDIESEICRTLPDLSQKISQVYGAVVLAEEALPVSEMPGFLESLQSQPPWSDVPVIVLTFHRSEPYKNFGSTERLSRLANVSLLERPCSRLTMLSAVEVALRSRRRQYQVRDLLLNQQEESRKRDEFFATLSHELRTPLNVILGWIRNCKSEEFDPKYTKKVFDILERNAEVQQGLIDDLLDISRIINGKLHIERRPVNIKQLAEDVIQSLQPKAFEKNIPIRFCATPSEAYVSGDKNRLVQVLSNLIINSIKFTPVYGEIEVEIGLVDQACCIAVADNGQGIAPEFLPYIFDRLKQENMTTTRAQGGLGLGLAIANHIVQAHEGEISAFSKGRGSGTKMEVRLPRASPPSEIVQPSPALEVDSELDGLRILVADDSLDILGLFEFWLSKLKVRYRLATSVAEAMSAVAEFRPDVIISDIGMPGEDGYSLIAKVRALPETQGGNTPVAALTAYARPEEKDLALRSGFDMHISKPIDAPKLYSAIKQLSAHSRGVSSKDQR